MCGQWKCCILDVAKLTSCFTASYYIASKKHQARTRKRDVMPWPGARSHLPFISRRLGWSLVSNKMRRLVLLFKASLSYSACCSTIPREVRLSLCPSEPQATFPRHETHQTTVTRLSNQMQHRPRKVPGFGLSSFRCVSAFLSLPSSYPLSLPHFLPSPMPYTLLNSPGLALPTPLLPLRSSQ